MISQISHPLTLVASKINCTKGPCEMEKQVMEKSRELISFPSLQCENLWVLTRRWDKGGDLRCCWKCEVRPIPGKHLHVYHNIQIISLQPNRTPCMIWGAPRASSQRREKSAEFVVENQHLAGGVGCFPRGWNFGVWGRSVPVEFFRAMSSALDVFRWSIRRLGMLKGGTCILSDENWCRSGRWRSGDGIDKLSSFSLFRCCRSMWSSISCRTYRNIHEWPQFTRKILHVLTSSKIVNCSRFKEGLTVCGSKDGITLVAIMFTESPYFLSLNIIR